MSYSFYLELDLNLKTLSDCTGIIEELLIAFIASTSKQKKMSDMSYKLELALCKSSNSVCPDREQKPNRVA